MSKPSGKNATSTLDFLDFYFLSPTVKGFYFWLGQPWVHKSDAQFTLGEPDHM